MAPKKSKSSSLSKKRSASSKKKGKKRKVEEEDDDEYDIISEEKDENEDHHQHRQAEDVDDDENITIIKEAFDTYANTTNDDDERNGTTTITIKRIKYALQEILNMETKFKSDEIRKEITLMKRNNNNSCRNKKKKKKNDDDDDGSISIESIDYNTFLQYSLSKVRQKEMSDTAFALLDVDGKGLICQQDIHNVLKKLDEETMFTEDEIIDMLNEADPSGEGLINSDALFRIVRKVNL